MFVHLALGGNCTFLVNGKSLLLSFKHCLKPGGPTETRNHILRPNIWNSVEITRGYRCRSHLSSTNGSTLQVSVRNFTTSMWPEDKQKRRQLILSNQGELDRDNLFLVTQNATAAYPLKKSYRRKLASYSRFTSSSNSMIYCGWRKKKKQLKIQRIRKKKKKMYDYSLQSAKLCLFHLKENSY